MKHRLTSIRFSTADDQVITDLQTRTGLRSQSEVVRLALRELKRSLGLRPVHFVTGGLRGGDRGGR